MTYFNSFISLGPSCLSASLLKTLNLRNCSYPFDWGQTGGLHLRDALIMEVNDYYYRHIAVPNVQLTQICNPESSDNNTATLRRKDHVYGHPFYHNPHRPIGSDKDYYIRCLLRFKDTVYNKNVKKIFVLSDYLDRPGEKYYKDPNIVCTYLLDTLSEYIPRSTFDIVLIRIRFDGITIARKEVINLDQNCKCCKITIPSLLSDSGFEKVVAKLALKEYINQFPLYFPDISDNN